MSKFRLDHTVHTAAISLSSWPSSGLVDATTTPNMAVVQTPKSLVPLNAMLVQSFYCSRVGKLVLAHSESLMKDRQFEVLKQVTVAESFVRASRRPSPHVSAYGLEFEIFGTFEWQRFRQQSAKRVPSKDIGNSHGETLRTRFCRSGSMSRGQRLGDLCQLTHGGMPALGSVVLRSPASPPGVIPAPRGEPPAGLA